MCTQDSGSVHDIIKIGIRFPFSTITKWHSTSYYYAGTEETGIPYYTEEGFRLTDTQLVALKNFFKSDTFVEACCDSTGMVAILICEAHDDPKDYHPLTISRGDQVFLKLV